jgi:hypothetical protein
MIMHDKPNWVNTAHLPVRNVVLQARMHAHKWYVFLLYRRAPNVKAVIVSSAGLVGVREGVVIAVLLHHERT